MKTILLLSTEYPLLFIKDRFAYTILYHMPFGVSFNATRLASIVVSELSPCHPLGNIEFTLQGKADLDFRLFLTLVFDILYGDLPLRRFSPQFARFVADLNRFRSSCLVCFVSCLLTLSYSCWLSCWLSWLLLGLFLSALDSPLSSGLVCFLNGGFVSLLGLRLNLLFGRGRLSLALSRRPLKLIAVWEVLPMILLASYIHSDRTVPLTAESQDKHSDPSP